jgi:hypothetical protein
MDIESAECRRHLAAYGWVDVSGVDDLLCLANSLGRPIPSYRNGPLVDTLRPTISGRTQLTFSSIYGMGEFPWHTDGAISISPPRYFVLRSISSGMTEPTLLLDVLKILTRRELLTRSMQALFSSRTPLSTSITPFVQHLNAMLRVRYDSRTMKPLNRTANLISDLIRDHEPDGRIYWTQNRTVVVDNYRMLHARPAIEDASRLLERVTVL